MFKAATLKLSAWYLGIVVVLAIIFSVIIYQISAHETRSRLSGLQTAILENAELPAPLADSVLRAQAEQAEFQLFLMVLYVNLLILIIGGAGSYYLAWRTVGPLEKAHEAQSRFTSDASHELRTPLAAMKTELEVTLRQKTLDEDEIRELLESNLEEVEKLIKLSEMLLELSRLEEGKLGRTRIDLTRITTRTLKKYKAEQKRFVLSSTPQLFVNANDIALEELLTILIDNALKYSPAKSNITVRTYRKTYQAHIEISNEGPTIPPEVLPRIFDRFVRGDASRTQSGQNGFGLGLAIAKKIVEVHQGDIKVISQDGMTTFHVSLPLAQAPRRTSGGKITTK